MAAIALNESPNASILRAPQENIVGVSTEEGQLALSLGIRAQALGIRTVRWIEEVASPPAGGSALERAYSDGDRNPFDTAQRLLGASADHIRALTPFLPPGGVPIPQYAMYSLIRAAGEAAVRAAYLLDPSLSESGRSPRMLAYRWENLLQAVAATKLLGPREAAEAEKFLDERRDYLLANAARLGVEATTRGRELVFDGNSLQRWNVRLFRDFLIEGDKDDDRAHGELIYRYLSGQSHAYQWAQVRPSRGRPSSDPEVSLVGTEVDLATLLWVSEPVLSCYQRSVRVWFTHAGMPADVWTDIVSAAEVEARSQALPLNSAGEPPS